MAFCSDSMPQHYHNRDNKATTNVIDKSGPITYVILLSIAERLKSAREAANLRQDELAARAGVSQGTIANVEGGFRKNPRELLAIARALGVNAEWLKSGKGTRESDSTGSALVLPDSDLGTSYGRSTKRVVAHLVAELGHHLAEVDEPRRLAIAELLSAVARKPEQAADVGEHIEALLRSRPKRAA
jgi:transcriptional regulator with XRE-family HTH domain